MAFTNYWDPTSGDSQASPWGAYSQQFGQAQTGFTPSSEATPSVWNGDPTTGMTTGGGLASMLGGDTNVWAGGTPNFDETTGQYTNGFMGGGKNWMQALQQPNNATSFLQQSPMNPPRGNDDTQHEDTRYGAATTAGSGGGYWSGGRPGAGTWVEANQVAPASPSPSRTVMTKVGQLTGTGDTITQTDSGFGHYGIIDPNTPRFAG